MDWYVRTVHAGHGTTVAGVDTPAETLLPVRQPPVGQGPPLERAPLRHGMIWVWSLIWLVELIGPIRAALRENNPVIRISGIALVLIFSAAFVASFVYFRSASRRGTVPGVRRRWAIALVVTALAGAAVILIGPASLTIFAFTAVLWVFLHPG